MATNWRTINAPILAVWEQLSSSLAALLLLVALGWSHKERASLKRRVVCELYEPRSRPEGRRINVSKKQKSSAQPDELRLSLTHLTSPHLVAAISRVAARRNAQATLYFVRTSSASQPASRTQLSLVKQQADLVCRVGFSF